MGAVCLALCVQRSSASMPAGAAAAAAPPKVMYFADDDVTAMDFDAGHIMRPVRVRMAHALVRSLGLHRGLQLMAAPPATPQELRAVHPAEFVAFLQASGAVHNLDDPCHAVQDQQYGTNDKDGDCPLFPALWPYVSSYCGASLAAARAVASGAARIAINWAGGMHHAKRARVHGFCYANDIVLAIEELLRTHSRVLYVDIDAHHGDGVEEAFLTDPRVLTLSVHQYGFDRYFFPGTGGIDDVGVAHGNGFAVNVPLPAYCGDALYEAVFASVLTDVARGFAPEAVVLQCGADTIYGDVIGDLRVSTRCFGRCAGRVIHGLMLPTVVLGGGGYNIANTARAWAVVTAVALQQDAALPLTVPTNDPYFFPHYVRPHRWSGGKDKLAPLDAPMLHVDVPAEEVQPPKARSARGGRKSTQQASVKAVDVVRLVIASVAKQMRGVRLVREQWPRPVAFPVHGAPLALVAQDVVEDDGP